MSRFTAVQLSNYLNMTKRAIQRRALKEEWNYFEQRVRGGLQRAYPFTGLPVDIQDRLIESPELQRDYAANEAKGLEAVDETLGEHEELNAEHLVLLLAREAVLMKFRQSCDERPGQHYRLIVMESFVTLYNQRQWPFDPITLGETTSDAHLKQYQVYDIIPEINSFSLAAWNKNWFNYGLPGLLDEQMKTTSIKQRVHARQKRNIEKVTQLNPAVSTPRIQYWLKSSYNLPFSPDHQALCNEHQWQRKSRDIDNAPLHDVAFLPWQFNFLDGPHRLLVCFNNLNFEVVCRMVPVSDFTMADLLLRDALKMWPVPESIKISDKYIQLTTNAEALTNVLGIRIVQQAEHIKSYNFRRFLLLFDHLMTQVDTLHAQRPHMTSAAAQLSDVELIVTDERAFNCTSRRWESVIPLHQITPNPDWIDDHLPTIPKEHRSSQGSLADYLLSPIPGNQGFRLVSDSTFMFNDRVYTCDGLSNFHHSVVYCAYDPIETRRVMVFSPFSRRYLGLAVCD